MGKLGSELVAYLEKALTQKVYRNLKFTNFSKRIFSLCLPHKTSRLEMEDEFVLKDWCEKKGSEYIFSKSYTKVKQAITASLRKSDYVELISSNEIELIYRILSSKEVEGKKRWKKQQKLEKEKRLKKEKLKNSPKYDSPPSVDSGYDTGIDSPLSCSDNVRSNDNLLLGVIHDHAFGQVLANPLLDGNDVPCNSNSSCDEIVHNEAILELDTGNPSLEGCILPCDFSYKYKEVEQNEIMEVDIGNANQSDTVHSIDAFNFEPTCNNAECEVMKKFVFQNHENVLLGDLDKIPMQDIVALNTEEQSELLQEFFGDVNLPSIDFGLTEDKAECLFTCNKFQKLDKMTILFCEPKLKDKWGSDDFGNKVIIFDEEIFDLMKNCSPNLDYKFINDHLLIFLIPKDS